MNVLFQLFRPTDIKRLWLQGLGARFKILKRFKRMHSPAQVLEKLLTLFERMWVCVRTFSIWKEKVCQTVPVVCKLILLTTLWR